MVKSVLVLGASGMLGHKMMQVLSSRGFTVSGTVRDKNIGRYEIIGDYPLFGGIDASKFDTISNAINKYNPDVVVNCIGIVKQLPESNDSMKSLLVNAVLPHKLATYCTSKDIKLIHISTDCVFDGKKSMYKESDVATADDIYGLTKYVGEINDSTNLTIRTSIIGREIITQHGLVEWFLSNRGKSVNGYKKSIFSGVTTNQLSHLVGSILTPLPKSASWNHFKNIITKETGLMHISTTPINKFDLITLINDQLPERDRVDIKIVDGEDVDRSLDSKFAARGDIIPSWKVMIKEMMSDPTPYDEIRSRHV